MDIHQEIQKQAREIEESPEEQPLIPPWLQRILIALLALALLLLMLSYFLTSGSVRSILIGLVQSSTVQDKTIQINHTNSLTFIDNTYEELLSLFNKNPATEFKACLTGHIKNGDYFIDALYIPKTYHQQDNLVVAEPCTSQSLVSLHSHPRKRCIASEQDAANFKRFKQRSPHGLMIIMCDQDRFQVYD